MWEERCVVLLFWSTAACSLLEHHAAAMLVFSLSRARIHQTAAKKANFALKWTSKVKTVLKLDLKTFLNLRELDGLRVDSR